VGLGNYVEEFNNRSSAGLHEHRLLHATGFQRRVGPDRGPWAENGCAEELGCSTSPLRHQPSRRRRRVAVGPQQGLLPINSYLESVFGIQGLGWLIDPRWIMPSISMMSVAWVGFNIVILLAGLQDPTFHEAAEIDGAIKWQIL